VEIFNATYALLITNKHSYPDEDLIDWLKDFFENCFPPTENMKCVDDELESVIDWFLEYFKRPFYA
jgi:hypothetical protein